MVIISKIKLNNSCGPGWDWIKAVIFCGRKGSSVCYIKHLFFQTKIVLPIRKKNCVIEVMVNSSFFHTIVILKENNIYFALAKRWQGA